MYLQKSDVENTVRDLMTDFDFFTVLFDRNINIGKKYLKKRKKLRISFALPFGLGH